jgi:hypothetical protein
MAGFSLTELIISLGLFSVVLAMVLSFLDQTRRNLETESSGIETQQGARVSIEELSFHIRQAGYGIRRDDPGDIAGWQRAVVWAGAHGIAFNADIDPARGAIDASVTLEFLDGSRYAGEGPADTIDGAETYYYSVDADGDGQVTPADHDEAEPGSYNPAAGTDNPLDYALFRRVFGYAGDDLAVRRIDPVTAHLFTNANPTDRFGDGTRPDPLFSYWLTEDLDGDGRLGAGECVVTPCPPAAEREPLVYLWGDTSLDGVLSDAERDALRSLAVGSPAWPRNPLAREGEMPATELAAGAAAGARTLVVLDAHGFVPGAQLELGGGEAAERATVVEADPEALPATIVLAAPLGRAYDAGTPLEVLPETMLRAIRSVHLRFGAITPERDYDASADSAARGRAGRVGTRGLDYRVLSLERRLPLANLKTRPAGR